MTKRVQKRLSDLQRNVERYGPEVRRKLRKSGRKANIAVVFSVAKYFNTLNRLAKE